MMYVIKKFNHKSGKKVAVSDPVRDLTKPQISKLGKQLSEGPNFVTFTPLLVGGDSLRFRDGQPLEGIVINKKKVKA